MDTERRWSTERAESGLRVRVGPAPLWRRVLGVAFPPLAIAGAFVAMLVGTGGHGGFTYVTIIAFAGVVREVRRWRRSTDDLLLEDGGVLMRTDDVRDEHDAPSLALGPDATIRVRGGAPGWALHDLLGTSAEPRVVARSGGQEITFGVGLTDDEAQDLCDRLAAEPAVAGARPAEPPPVAAVTRTRGAIGGRSGDVRPVALSAEDAVKAHRRSPLSSTMGVADLGIVVASPIFAALAWWGGGFNAVTTSALSVMGLAATIPSLVRFSRTAFAGSCTAQVVDGPAHCGSTATVRFSLDRNAAEFKWLDLRLQYVRTEASRRKWGLVGRMDDHVVWEGLYRLPEGRYPPGPDEHVDAVFAIPGNAPPTSARPTTKWKASEHWRLRVDGRTRYRDYSEWFPVVVLPLRGELRPAAARQRRP